MKKRILNFLLTRLVKLDIEKELISFDRLKEEEKVRVIAEAKYFRSTLLYDLIMKKADYQIRQNMFVKSACWDDVFIHKACFYVISVLRELIKDLSNIRIPIKRHPKGK